MSGSPASRSPVDPMRVIVATGNAGKAREFGRLLGPHFSVGLLPSTVSLPEETGVTFAENATLKATSVWKALGGSVAVLADDSGLEVDALGGEPGVRSARYSGEEATDERNVALLLSRLEHTDDRHGRFICALALVVSGDRSPEPVVYEAVGLLEGRIAPGPAGMEGFGYDPVFVPEGWTKTLGQAAPGEKDSVSHRSRAVAGLLRLLKDRGVLARG